MKYIILLILITSTQTVMSQRTTQYKSLLVYKISEYVVWPNNPEKVNIGTFGRTEVHDVLTKFARKKDHMTVSSLNQVSDLGNCHLVYLPEEQSGLLSDIRSKIGNTSVLIVSEDKDMIRKGADVVIFMDNGKLKYVVNEGSIMAKGMTPSRKLAALGTNL